MRNWIFVKKIQYVYGSIQRQTPIVLRKVKLTETGLKSIDINNVRWNSLPHEPNHLEISSMIRI